jgi:hypothetical protein
MSPNPDPNTNLPVIERIERIIKIINGNILIICFINLTVNLLLSVFYDVDFMFCIRFRIYSLGDAEINSA